MAPSPQLPRSCAGGLAASLAVGIVVGHRFLLEGDLALTPFVHPRLSLDLCNDCASDDTEFGLVFEKDNPLVISGDTVEVMRPEYWRNSQALNYASTDARTTRSTRETT